jgi:hypothetical protein
VLFNSILMRLFAMHVPATNLCLTGDLHLVSAGGTPDVTGQLNRTIRVAVSTRAKRA